jgi:hypothetical protein
MTIDSTVLGAFLSGVVGPIIVLYLKQRYDKRKQKSDMITEALEVSSLVNTKIEHIKQEFGADRVWITQFHNGGHFYPTGKSMAKFSVIYETVNIGANSIQSNYQNIPVNLFSKSINELLQNDIIEIPDFKDETVGTFGLKYIAEENNCKSQYLFAIKTIEGKFVGQLVLDFTKKKVRLDAESINHLAVHASAIGGVLAGHLEQK